MPQKLTHSKLWNKSEDKKNEGEICIECLLLKNKGGIQPKPYQTKNQIKNEEKKKAYDFGLVIFLQAAGAATHQRSLTMGKTPDAFMWCDLIHTPDAFQLPGMWLQECKYYCFKT